MKDVLQGKAYAKINLFLDVTGKLSDGYHSVATVMQSISLRDNVKITLTPSDRTVIQAICDNPAVPNSAENLAWRAAEMFLSEIGKTADVKIEIDKHIPVSAGLGGGSSDAACVLRLLNVYYGKPLNYEQLSALASKIGADVPFCLKGGTQTATGKGDILTPLHEIPKCYFVVAIANEKVSTPDAYAKLDKAFNNFEGYAQSPKYDLIKQAVADGDRPSLLSNMYNVFEDYILAECKGAAEIKSAFEKASAEAILLCGSGPAVFGVFPNSDTANNAVLRMGRLGVTVYFTKPASPEWE